MKRRMSKKQVSERVKRVNAEIASDGSSGWSIKAYGPNRGSESRDVFAVSLPAEEVEEPLSVPVTEPALTAYQKKHKTLLKQPKYFHGGWAPSEGVGSQDVSMAFPRTEEGLVNAMITGAAHQQRAIGDVGVAGYEGDIEIPPHLSSAQFPRRMSVSEENGVVDIMPSRQEMHELAVPHLEKAAREEWAKRTS